MPTFTFQPSGRRLRTRDSDSSDEKECSVLLVVGSCTWLCLHVIGKLVTDVLVWRQKCRDPDWQFPNNIVWVGFDDEHDVNELKKWVNEKGIGARLEFWNA